MRHVINSPSYPYYINNQGNIVEIIAKINKKEADYEERLIHDIFYHICSGLYDKTNKLIYEGDIVDYNGTKNVVKFVKGCFFLESEDKENLTPLLKCKQDKLEVIGNIIENPLKKEKQAKAPLPKFKKS